VVGWGSGRAVCAVSQSVGVAAISARGGDSRRAAAAAVARQGKSSLDSTAEQRALHAACDRPRARPKRTPFDPRRLEASPLSRGAKTMLARGAKTMLGRLLATAAAARAVTTTFQDATILVDQRIRGIKQMNAKIVGVGRNGCATPGAHRLGRCVLSADERAAVNRSRAAPRNGTIVLAVSTGDCQGHFGLWHYLNRCVANLYRATGGAPAALALLMHTSQSSKDACGYNPCMRGLSPFRTVRDSSLADGSRRRRGDDADRRWTGRSDDVDVV